MFIRTRPKDYHLAIIEHMMFARYQNVSSGVCYGIAGMALQAILQSDTSTYNRRIKLLAETSPIALRYLRCIAHKKWNDIAAGIEKKLKLSVDQKYYSTEYKALLDHAFDQLDNKTQDLLTINAFFDGVSSYQAPFDYENSLEHPYSKQTQNIKSSLSLTMTAALEASGGIASVSNESSAYTEKELHTMLESIHKVYKSHRTDFPMGFVLSNFNHAFTIGLDPKTERWIFIEVTNGPSKLLTNHSMASKIHEIFTDNKITIFNTEIYTTERNRPKAEKIITEWKSTNEFGTSHFISSERARYLDSNNASLLFVAAQNGNIQTVKELLQLLSITEINRNTYSCPTALFVAAQNGELEIVKLLLEHGANVHADLPANGSPLVVAAQKKHVEIMKVLLKHGANFDEIADDEEAVELLLGQKMRPGMSHARP